MKRRRHRLLLDENLPNRRNFPSLNDAHDLVHILERSSAGLKDPEVLNIALQENRVVVTRNGKDFLRLHLIQPFGLIIIDEKMTYEDIDKKICAFLRTVSLQWSSVHHIASSPRRRRG